MGIDRALVLVLAAAAGCYKPVVGERCTVQCDPLSRTDQCPAGLGCYGGVCRASATDTCSGPLLDAPSSDTPMADAPPDAAVNSDACVTYGSPGSLYQYPVCSSISGVNLALSGTVDTNTGCPSPYSPVTTPGGSICMAVGDHITVNGLSVSGKLPLVLVANQIDVSATITSTAGSGRGCLPKVDGQIGAGGAGGTAGATGGNGGAGNGGGAGANGTSSLSTIAGGCPGGAGANALSGGAVGNGGLGGGVIYLIGKTQVSLAAGVSLVAGGKAGQGGASGGSGGGGGGGSGGLIVIDTPTLTVGTNVSLCAEGGGGGGGGGSVGSMTGAGSIGSDACGVTNPAGGGGGAAGGGLGGNGSSGGVGLNGGDETVSGAGGGGGGGGTGWIRAYGGALTAITNATCMPAAQ